AAKLAIVLGVDIGLGLVVIWVVFKTNLGQTLLALLGLLVASVAYGALVSWVVQPYVFELYAQTTSSMSPTLVGSHQKARCPHCGDTLIVPYYPELREIAPDRKELSVCQSCQKTSEVEPSQTKPAVSDRFFCNKLQSPQRWDLVVFRLPMDWNEGQGQPHGTVKWVKRLVGLPGEKIVIKEGTIWIDGKKADMPDDLAKVRFEAGDMPFGGLPWGSPDRPARLGQGEYFVIGDFSERSSDSRHHGPLAA